MVNLIKYDSFAISEYICDTVADVDYLPDNATIGSTAFIIENSAVYMKGSNEWRPI